MQNVTESMVCDAITQYQLYNYPDLIDLGYDRYYNYVKKVGVETMIKDVLVDGCIRLLDGTCSPQSKENLKIISLGQKQIDEKGFI